MMIDVLTLGLLCSFMRNKSGNTLRVRMYVDLKIWDVARVV